MAHQPRQSAASAAAIDPATSAVRPLPLVEQTLNGTGCTVNQLDEFALAFVDFAADKAPGPALDIGAAYGVATFAALARGATVIANDVDPRHLWILESRAPRHLRGRLSVRCATFPERLQMEKESLGAILASRVFHFFSGPQIELSAQKMYDWLMPGGKAFVVVEEQMFLQTVELRAIYEANKAAKQPWPGFVEDVAAVYPGKPPEMPNRLHYIEQDDLRRAFTRAGFKIDDLRTFQRQVVGPRDGVVSERRCLGLVARRS